MENPRERVPLAPSILWRSSRCDQWSTSSCVATRRGLAAAAPLEALHHLAQRLRGETGARILDVDDDAPVAGPRGEEHLAIAPGAGHAAVQEIGHRRREEVPVAPGEDVGLHDDGE